ncbi:MAG TPA: DUF5995 family protein [Gaiellaceae bacterium]
MSRAISGSLRQRLRFGAVVGALALVFAAGAKADDPIYLPWPSLLPSLLTTPYDPTSSGPCRNGSPKCVDQTVAEMERSFDQLAADCSHEAIFSLSYLRVTQMYEQTVSSDPNFFDNTPFVNHEDAIFAGYYFQAFDNWYGGRPSRVPPAWQIAFAAADSDRVSGSGDLMLGINAHVNRDLPFVLASMGLFNADGSSRKPDHDKVNVILNKVEGPILAEASRRFDSSILDPTTNGTTLDETSLFQELSAWREEAWRNAERLAAATTDAQRAHVAQSIENAAALEAQTIVAAFSYVPPLTTTKTRDAYCAQHWDDQYP